MLDVINVSVHLLHFLIIYSNYVNSYNIITACLTLMTYLINDTRVVVQYSTLVALIRKFTVSDASFSQTALKGEVGKNKQKNQEVAKI